MDFFQFLQNSKTETKKSEATSILPQVKEEIQDRYLDYESLQKGDYIKIIRLDQGTFNHFKGYIGEIKQYRKGSDSAMIILHAVNYPKLYKVPVAHFKKVG